MSEFLQVKDISKVFNPEQEFEVAALSGINLAIGRGEFVVISGPSGSGKTTLLNIIGGLDAASGGAVILDGLTLTDLAEKELCLQRRDHIGFVFQAYNLIPVLTARENIEYVMKLQGKSQQDCDARVVEIAEKLGIAQLLNKLPNQLSGGQQQRVAVARAVASKPKLILADEPTANLDSGTAAELMAMMEKLNREERITVIFSSHDPMVIAKARRSIILRDGRVVQNEITP
ncbi:MAG: ABC transporter ATP-binding protein [Desulfobulbaceae bacterium]|nr:ABC transporter ATP-binding protein [Desulfobulbaceae bacterium]HIJ79653.1 ABC transporter ATP-binding protein [Deltaproteobacteria bacterium]